MRSAWLRVVWVATVITLLLAPLGNVAPGAASTADTLRAFDSRDNARLASSEQLSSIGVREEAQVVEDEGADAPGDGDPNQPANLRKLAETNAPVRLIVQLVDPPVASYTGGAAGLPATKPQAGGRVDVQSAPAAQYSAFLADRRNAAIGALTAAAPGTVVERQYDTVLNGLAVKTTGASIDRIAQLPGVKRVTVARQYQVDMDSSLPIVGLISGTLSSGIDTGLWAAVGGHEHAGEGVKVAIIDSGIYIDNPFFNPNGFTCPPGFPRYDPGFASYANCKVIVARAYFRPDDPPDPTTDGPDPLAHPSYEHGSHTAGTVGGVFSTTTQYLAAGIPPISGVAPRAWLMNYRAMYKGASGYLGAQDPELIAAIEDAVRDGADVVNNSWGGPPGTSIADDPVINAYSAAVEAGLIVVFSNGNTGAGQQTTATPAGSEKFISVGATTASRVLTYRLDAVGAGVPVTVTNIAAYPGNGPAITTTIGPAPYVDSKAATNSTNTLGCSAFSSGLFTDVIALIERGSCNPVIKINNAAAAGAIAVVLINDSLSQLTLSGLNTTTIPAVVVARQLGLNLRSWYASNPTSAALRINPGTLYNPGWQDAVASFSSRGPSLSFNIKPDVAAPGVNILSAYLGGFEFKNGTSMAGPHVAGAAALLRQLYPDWSPAQVKSALMATAATPGALSANPMDRGAGRIDLGAAGDPGLTFDQPSLSFGVVAPGAGPMTLTVTARNVARSDAPYSLSAAQTISNTNLTIGTPTPTISVPMSGTTTFQVVVNAAAGTPPTDYFGQVNLTDGVHNLHIPYWVRVVNPAGLSPARNKLLLIDDDMSNCVATSSVCKNTGDFGDFRGIWSQTLTELGVDFDVWDTNPVSTTVQPVPWDIAQQYGKVVWFTGDSRGHAWYVTGGIGTEPFRYFLSNNGRLIASGQDLVTGLTLSGMTSSTTGLLLGAVRLADTLGNTLPARPSLQAGPQAPPVFAGQVYDLNAITTTAGLVPDGSRNQRSIDELQAPGDADHDSLPLFVATGVTGAAGDGTVGTLISSAPSLERLAGQAPWSHLGYRTATLGFGLEAVNNNTGYGTREQLLGSLLSWLDDEVTLTGTWLSPTTTVGPGQALMFQAEARSSLASSGQTVPMQRFRWDFGDGTPIQTSSGLTQTTISHAFQTPGAYQVRVEAVDAYGHRTVRDVALVAVGGSIAVPIGTGWNNVSLPVSRTAQLTASGLVAELAGQGIVVDQVVQWSNGGWLSYLPGFPGSDFPIELGRGYFVRSQTFGTWHAAGIPIRDAAPGTAPDLQTQVATGWNNISLPASQTVPLTASGLVARLAEQGVATDQIVRWHNGGWQTHIASFPFNDFPIESGQAYFVRSRTFGTWRPTQ